MEFLVVCIFTAVTVQGVSVQRGLCPGGTLPGGGSYQGCLCPEGSLSRRSLSRGVSVQGGLCPGGLCPEGSLSGGSLSGGISVWGFSVQKTLSRGVSVQGVSVKGKGYLSRGGILCPGEGFCVQGGLCLVGFCQGDLHTLKSGRYASYSKAFLLYSYLLHTIQADHSHDSAKNAMHNRPVLKPVQLFVCMTF